MVASTSGLPAGKVGYPPPDWRSVVGGEDHRAAPEVPIVDDVEEHVAASGP